VDVLAFCSWSACRIAAGRAPGRHRVDDVVLGRHGEEHVQHVRAVVEVVARVDEGLAKQCLNAAAETVGILARMRCRRSRGARLWLSMESW